VIVAVIVPRDSSAWPEAMLPPVVDRFTDELVRAVLLRVFSGRWPSRN
jgi:hypothetical protein